MSSDLSISDSTQESDQYDEEEMKLTGFGLLRYMDTFNWKEYLDKSIKNKMVKYNNGIRLLDSDYWNDVPLIQLQKRKCKFINDDQLIKRVCCLRTGNQFPTIDVLYNNWKNNNIKRKNNKPVSPNRPKKTRIIQAPIEKILNYIPDNVLNSLVNNDIVDKNDLMDIVDMDVFLKDWDPRIRIALWGIIKKLPQ